jgi:glycosyltransferase involved in cell wall biosynthesis
LYPSAAYPGSGPFVRDEVVELARQNALAVVAPLPWHALRYSEAAKRVASVPHATIEEGIRVVRPRLPGIPIGGRVIEPYLWALRMRSVVGRLREELDADLIHAHFALPDGFAAADYASRERVPLVVSVWGSDVLVAARRHISRTLLERTFKRSRAVIAVSDELADRVRELGAPIDGVHVIPGGVPYPPRHRRDAARAALGVPDGSICVLWVGGLLAVKQPLQGIEAFAQFAREVDREALLVMIGDGPLRKRVAEFARTRGVAHAVRMIGYRDRPEVWMWECASDVLLNSSRSEGTPLAVLEALGAGTPVAAYPLPGVRAVVEHLGGGAIAANFSAPALARAIVVALTSPRNRDGLASDAQSRFAIGPVARRIQDVYEAVS